VKVPHHGSGDAHHEDMWDQLVDDNAVAIVTPFSNGSVQRPSEADIARLCRLAIRLYATAISFSGAQTAVLILWGGAGKGCERAARGTALSAAKRRERCILPPAASGVGEAGLRPAKAAPARG
jgi:hypothetical protein